MSRGQSLAIAGLSCALLCAWGAFAFLRGTLRDVAGAGGATRGPADAAAAGLDRAPTDRADEPAAASDKSATNGLHATVVAVDPRLEWPDAATLRRIEQRGRTLFGGVVYAPDGSPCPGASVWCGATLIATTDDHGAWRADVARPFDFENDIGRAFGPGNFPAGTLAARKPGVGFAHTEVEPFSHQVELHLQRGFNFSGTVVDNDDLHPVGGVELVARVAWLEERTQSDALGRFSFPNLPSGGIDGLDLSATARGYDSNGTFPYNFDRGRDVEVTFRLTRAYRLRGRFVPWPVPGVAPAAATVVLVPSSPHGKGSDRSRRGTIGPDGAFDLPLPVCPDCRVEIEVEGASLWQSEVDVNEEKHDVDLGIVDLGSAEIAAAPATLTGRIDVPDERLCGLLKVEASVSIEGMVPTLIRTRLASDGSFRLAPLVPGYVGVGVEFEGFLLATTEEASGLTPAERASGAGFHLAAGETRDAGLIVPTREGVLFGTVRDTHGEPIGLARIGEEFQFAGRSNDSPVTGWVSTTDEEGRFLCGQPLETLPSSSNFTVWARGFMPQRFTLERLPGVGWFRHDVVLGDGVVLRGRLVDEAGAPLAGWAVYVDSNDATGDHSVERAANDVTQADGSFEIRGLEAGEWRVRARPKGGTLLEFTKIHPERGAITLRTSDGVAVATKQ